MIYLYRFLLPVFSIFALPYYIFRMIRRGGYSHKFLYRAGLWPKLPPKTKGTSRIWIQAVSVGELSSLGKVLQSLLNHSNIEIVLSGTTSTGLMLGEKKYSDRLLHMVHFLRLVSAFPKSMEKNSTRSRDSS